MIGLSELMLHTSQEQIEFIGEALSAMILLLRATSRCLYSQAAT